MLASGCDVPSAGDGDVERPRAIDERAGTYGGVRFGASEADVRRLFGAPAAGDGYLPAGGDFRGREAIPARDGRPTTLRYEDAAFLASPARGVYSLMVAVDGAATRAGVGVGDSLERVREHYAGVRCGESVAGEPLVGDDPPTYRWCRTRVGRIDVFFGGDPIEPITLTLLGG